MRGIRRSQSPFPGQCCVPPGLQLFCCIAERRAEPHLQRQAPRHRNHRSGRATHSPRSSHSAGLSARRNCLTSEAQRRTTALLLGLLLLWWLLFASSAISQEAKPQLKISVDATTVTVGDVVTVKLSVKHASTLKVAFAPVGATLGEWTVRSWKQLPTATLADGYAEEVLEVQIAAYKTGDLEVPALNVEVAGASGGKDILASEPVKITVQSVLTGKEDTLRDLKPQADIEADYRPLLLLLVAVASAAYLVYRLARYLKGRRRPPSPAPERLRSAEEVAREAIERLLSRKLVEQGHFKLFYLELSEIVKRFLGSKLGVISLERTTEEFTRDLRAISVPAAQYRMIREFLDDCDLVKFAKYRPGQEEVEQIVARSWAMIDEMCKESAKPQEVGAK